MSIGRDHEAIDLMKLFSQGNNDTWNQYLVKLQKTKDFEGGLKVRFGIQAGMSDLEKKKMTSPAIDTLFASLIRSIDKNLRWIYRAKFPNPMDDPLNKKVYTQIEQARYTKAKRDRDQKFEQILRERSY